MTTPLAVIPFPRPVGRKGLATRFACGCEAEPDPQGTVALSACSGHLNLGVLRSTVLALLEDLESGVLAQRSSRKPGSLSQQAERRTRRHLAALRCLIQT